jgi:glutamate N-acetyltransferase/amino-acid N-acetyltransferase
MVTFARGFKASGVACGLKKNGRKDLAVVVSDNPCVCSGVYTTNIVKGHSLQLTMERMRN